MSASPTQARVAIGPIDRCGQPYFWARAVRKRLAIEALSFAPAGRWHAAFLVPTSKGLRTTPYPTAGSRCVPGVAAASNASSPTSPM